MNTIQSHLSAGSPNWDKDQIKEQTDILLKEIYEYSKRLYAERGQSLLIILQGIDASGKDGLTRSLFQEVSPAWVNVHSFKKPSEEEAAHDFLWRIHKRMPEKGMITVFNRSHYEDILVPSVYGYLDAETINARYEQINRFEEYLEANGTRILKFFLNISYEKQEIKLMERVNTAEKHWKHSDGDWETRERWDAFMAVYNRILNECNRVPWHVLPCDHNWTKLYSAAQLVVDTLKEMNPQYPALDSERFTPDYSKRKMRY